MQHLRILSEVGLITKRKSTHPRGSGPITYWRADRNEVEVVLERFVHHLLGEAR